MATKKAKKKQTKVKKAPPKKKAAPKKASAKKKPAPKKPAVKAKPPVKKKAGVKGTKKKSVPFKKKVQAKSQSANIDSFASEEARTRSAGQSGDLQGLSDAADADSESVDELIEEGNAFEAGVVSGVEEADSEDEREVHTHEVPEDDVPSEYLDEE
jgi:hypothetical protein